MLYKRVCISIFVIASLLIILRLALPFAVIHYVEKQINKIPGYQVSIQDLDIHLYRGSYTIKGIQLWKIQKRIPVPFFAAQSIDLSVQWKALLQRRFVGKVIILHPALNFVTDPRGKNEQLSISNQWVNIAKTLFPLHFNEITLQEGVLSFRSFSGHPPFDIFLDKVNLTIKNMQNTNRSTETLPSSFTFTADTPDDATVEVEGKFNPFVPKPAFTVNASLKNMNIKTVEGVLRHYTSLHVERGRLSFYFQAKASNGKIKGYAEPFIKDLKISPLKNAGPLEVLYHGVANIAAAMLKNSQSKAIATHVDIEGSIEGPDTNVLSIIGYLLKNAFIAPLLPRVFSQPSHFNRQGQ